ncbi:MAG: T9SS type A sorting domain-containing protein [Ignavibacteria bacterium]|jgi:photosystem II stability/assembly factor-like uncharacterized protein
MKKLLLFIPLLIIFLHLMYANDGPNVWSTDFTTYGRILAVNVNPSPQTTVYAGSIDSGLVKSTNSGLNWFTSNSGLNYKNVQCLSISVSNPSTLYAGTDSLAASSTDKGVYKSVDAGATWHNVNNDGFTSDRSIQAIAVDPTNANIVYAGIFNATHDATDGIWKTTNGGTNWVIANTGMGTDKNILCIAIDPVNPNTIYAGTSFNVLSSVGPVKIYKSTNAGALWTDISNGLPQLTTDINPVRCITVSTANSNYVGAVLFMNVTTGGFFLSTNGGASWTLKSSGLPPIAGANPRACLFRPGSILEIYAGIDYSTGTGGVYRTTDGGNNWLIFNSGPILGTYAFRTFSFRTAPDSTLYGGVGATATATTPGQGVYEYTFVPVGIRGENNNIPKDFALYQNYPNPFNPTTVITFDLPRQTNVTIKVYDISGKEVKTIMNENKTAGSYNVTFNASSLSSGVYFYRINAGDYSKTMKMALIK